jgi:hypothetical protein
MRKLALSAGAALIVLGSAGSADAQFRYRPGFYGYGYAPGYYGGYYPGPVYRPRYAYGLAPFYGPGIVCRSDPYAMPHEIRGGFRTIYLPDQGRRVYAGGPPC